MSQIQFPGGTVMKETVSIHALKTLIEKKIKKKTLIKVMWNDNDKLTLFITPNIKINSFIYDEKEGYLFYDHDGKQVKHEIPCVVTQDRKSTRLNSSHVAISYAVFCLKKKNLCTSDYE